MDMLILSSDVKRNQAGDMRRQTRAQESTPRSSGTDDNSECLSTAQAVESPEHESATHLAVHWLCSFGIVTQPPRGSASSLKGGTIMPTSEVKC